MHILVNTGGGDAPGLNAVIRAVTLSAINKGWKVSGIRDGYNGLLADPIEDGLIPLTREAVRGIAFLGGTILGTANKGNPFEYPVEENGEWVEKDISDEVVARFKETGADALVCIGGDGSLRIAQKFYQKGIPLVGVPKTIDNDIAGTIATFGFDSAFSFATEAIERLHATAESHRRVMVVEVMGRYAGWIALHAGVAGTADAILIPEIPFDIDKVCEKIRERESRGRHFSIVVCAEGAMPVGGSMTTVADEIGKEVTLGGIGEIVSDQIAERTGKESRCVVLGHLQRGGMPTARDRLLSTRFGAGAVRLVEHGDFGKMVALLPPKILAIPIEDAVSRMKAVPVDGDTVQTARDLGVCLGD